MSTRSWLYNCFSLLIETFRSLSRLLNSSTFYNISCCLSLLSFKGLTKVLAAGFGFFTERRESDLLETSVVIKSSYLFLSSSTTFILNVGLFSILSNCLSFNIWMFFRVWIFFIYFSFIILSSSSIFFCFYYSSFRYLSLSSSILLNRSFYFFCLFQRAILAAASAVFYMPYREFGLFRLFARDFLSSALLISFSNSLICRLKWLWDSVIFYSI